MVERRSFLGYLLATLVAGPSAWKEIADAQGAREKLAEKTQSIAPITSTPIARLRDGYFVKLRAEAECKIGQLVETNVHGRIVPCKMPRSRPIGIVVAHAEEPLMEIVQVYDQVL